MRIGKTIFYQDVTHHQKCEIGADPMSKQHKARESDTWLAKMILYDTKFQLGRMVIVVVFTPQNLYKTEPGEVCLNRNAHYPVP